MRYDQTITFVSESGTGSYNPVTHDYDTPTETKTNILANISNMSIQRQQIAYGDIKNTRLTIRLQRIYNDQFDYIEYNGEKYSLDTNITPKNSTVLTVVKNG